MNYSLLLLLIFYTTTFSVYGSVVEVDDDGFEIVSTEPSQASLDKINLLYKSTVRKIFENKCLSCHGKNDSLPWYYQIPGPKQLLDYDMKEAKNRMNMTNDFPFIGHGSAVDDLRALTRTLSRGDMPPKRYSLINWGSKLTEDEVRVITEWIRSSELELSK